MLLNGEQYYPFIKTLYKGMGEYCFKDLSVRLYRGARMSNEELNKMTEVLKEKETFDSKINEVIKYAKINNEISFLGDKEIIPKILFYSRCFLSFSRNISVASNFSSNVLLELHLDYIDLNEIQSNSDISKFSVYSSEEEIVFYPFSSFSIEKIIKENGKTKIILECLGKYKDAINKITDEYKNNFISFEESVVDSSFYNDIKNSKYIKLEDCLEVVFTKITNTPYQHYQNKNNCGFNKGNNNNTTKNEEKIIKDFVEDLFKWANK